MKFAVVLFSLFLAGGLVEIPAIFVPWTLIVFYSFVSLWDARFWAKDDCGFTCCDICGASYTVFLEWDES